MTGEKVFVTPALARDYRRLTALFPYSYRRAHQAEMLGHLLAAAAPGQSRPAPGERSDLLRAAAREWLLAPLGSAPRQRRGGTEALLLLLPLLLALPAAAALGGAARALGTADGPGAVLALAPMTAPWVLWAAGALALVAASLPVARGLFVAAAVMAWLTIALLIARGELLAAFTAAGWAVGHTACAVVSAERAAWGSAPAWSVGRRIGVLVAALAAGLPVMATAPYPGLGPLGVSLSGGATVVVVVVGLIALAWSRRLRQSVPIVLGVVSAVVLGRTGMFGSRLAPLEVVDLGNVLGLLAASAILTALARWVVNRIDELAAARARLGDDVAGLTTTTARMTVSDRARVS